jgi:diguanylate cyclase (GGDEF)-like protein/PAS domain S-box-containing protein
LQTFYWIPYLFTSILNALLAVYILKHRMARGAVSLFMIATSNALWALLDAILMMGLPLAVRMNLCYTQYIFIVQVPTFFIIFVMEYMGISRSFRRTHYPYLFIIPILTIIAAWTNPIHNMFYSQYMLISSQGKEELSLSYGPLFIIWAAYAYIVMIVATIIIFRAYISTSALYKKQYGTILLGVLIPWISNALYIFDLLPVENFDPTSLAYTITAICLIWAFYNRKLFDLRPIARSEAFKGMSDGVLILDDQNRIADFNPAAQMIMDFLSTDLIGEKLSDLCEVELAAKILMENTAKPLHLNKDGKSNFYDLRISYLSDRKDRAVGRILSFRDITKQKQMEAQLKYYATTDSLTGILNRRHFNHLAEIELHRCIRYNSPLSLCMIDIDHFKDVNDNYGHDIGDIVMKEMVKVCQQNLREVDLFSRWGGEEFVLLLPETGLESASEVAERLRGAIEKTDVQTSFGKISITISIGVVQLNITPAALEEGLKNADRAMYHAKGSGRNRCSILDNQDKFTNIS